MKLSSTLKSIYDLELDLGNKVARIDEPAGTKSPYGVVFQMPLHLMEIRQRLTLADSVIYWESTDPHYEIECGYACNLSKHTVSGPMHRRRPADVQTVREEAQ